MRPFSGIARLLGLAPRLGLASLGLAALGLAGCGDIGVIEVDVTFPSEELELRTRALRFVVREVPEDGSSGCDALWGTPQPDLDQSEEVTAYPNRNDVLAAPVSLDYPALSILVYAHPAIETVVEVDEATGKEEVKFSAVGDAIAGGCLDTLIDDPTVTRSIEVVLEPPPGASS